MTLTRRAFLLSSAAGAAVATLPIAAAPAVAKWTPSKRDVLGCHYDTWKGLPVCEPSVCRSLEEDGFLTVVGHPLYRIEHHDTGNGWTTHFVGPGRTEPYLSLHVWKITERGRQVVELLRGERNYLPFRAPNWVLVEGTPRK